MRIVAKGDQCIVKLEDKISGEWYTVRISRCDIITNYPDIRFYCASYIICLVFSIVSRVF